LIEKCRRINIVVGDNGSGKTALLEAIFLALGSTTSLPIRHRQQRGLESSFSGQLRNIEREIWQDYFFQNDWDKTIEIKIIGDGPEARSVRISRQHPQMSLSLSPDSELIEQGRAQILFHWVAASGREYELSPTISQDKIDFPETNEDLGMFSYFSATQAVHASEAAQRFSALDKKDEGRGFVEAIRREFPWITDITVQTVAGSPALFASLKDRKYKLPLANVSGGINRWAGIMLGAFSYPKSVVLVDEIENGLYFGHHKSLWRGLISTFIQSESQLIVTTHSQEWLRSLVNGLVRFWT